MRASRFIEYVSDLLTKIEHPDIVSVEGYSEPGVWLNPCGVKVTMRDGRVVWLRVTRTSPAAGDNFGEPESIPFPDYRIPEAVKELAAWSASAHTAV
jgi:hypothetical protein